MCVYYVILYKGPECPQALVSMDEGVLEIRTNSLLIPKYDFHLFSIQILYGVLVSFFTFSVLF